jgi:hypothetical protein
MLLPGSYKGTRKRRHARPRTLEEIYQTGGNDVIDREKYAGNDIIRVDDVKSGQSATIDWFQEIKTTLKDRPVQPAVQLSEFPGKYLALNTTNLDTLIEKFGNEEDKWKGKKIKLVIVQTQKPDGTPAKGIRIE